MINPKEFTVFKNQKILHAYSTREGGISSGVFSSLNLGRNTQDNKNRVLENRTLFFKHLGINQENAAIPQQIHSDNIEVVHSAGTFANTDGLITNMPGVILTIQTADCFPVYIYDPQKHVCAIVHSGWRGTAKGIVTKTLNKMAMDFSCSKEDFLIAIGAGIQQRNYQIDEATAQNFNRDFLTADGTGHYKLDVQGAIISQIKDFGVPSKNVEYDTACTFEEKARYYSYRRDGKLSGRMMGIIGLLRR